ncbi:serine hydrolase domain-containing protein [Nakamurella sp.]|uniref:serine hydrolase domain-containing protein n=1 Tax=Nakamurella sp. TaxID=1869182 RepID=UPI0037837FFC
MPRADRGAASTALLDQALAADAPGCSAAAGVEGAVAWTGARGVADTDAGLPLTTDTRFDTASVGKQFTATAILLLAQDGKLALTDSLARHVPGLPAWAEQVTLQDLMHHTSGLRDVLSLLYGAGFTMDDAVRQPDALAEIAQIEELNFTPGSVFEYSNTNYVLLGEIVRTASGMALPQFLQERVFGPLGLVMSFGRDSVADLPSGHTTTLGQVERSGAAWLLDGPGFIVTTPSELVRWADNYRTGEVGGPALLDQVTRDAHPVSSAPDADRYGAGVDVAADGTLVHSGEWAGMLSLFAVSPDRRAAVAITCNRDDIGPALTDLGKALTSIWFGPS